MSTTAPDAPIVIRRPTPLLPEAGAAGAPLTIVIAVLAFMASVSLASYSMVSRAAANWTGDLAGAITVQIKGSTVDSITEQARIVTALLDSTTGVSSISQYTREESEDLLAPWLGQGNLGADIPIPALISADVTLELKRDIESLRTRVQSAAPGATLDDHGVWNDRLVSAARRSQWVAFVVFLMVMSAAASVIIFAARAGLAANRHIVEVMHLVGAADRFIADQVQRRYFTLGLQGGGAGTVFAGLLLFVAASFQGSEEGFFLPNLGAAPGMLVWLLLVPIFMCAIAATAARVTVLKTLQVELSA